MDYYDQIFKRKSFHIFRNTEMIDDVELLELKQFINNVKPLDDNIKYTIEIVDSDKRGAQYSILFYSEEKENYLRNIGYIGEQIDLYLSSKNIGALWYGIGKPKEMIKDHLSYVIMICIAKMPSNTFRKDMYKAKRKPLEEIWCGDTLGIANIVRFSPSACNTQPWYVENKDNELFVYRYRKPGKRGIMPKNKVMYYNRIDIGIFMFMLETCLLHEGYEFDSKQYYEDKDEEKILVASYKINYDKK